jgi:hypothetical protein
VRIAKTELQNAVRLSLPDGSRRSAAPDVELFFHTILNNWLIETVTEVVRCGWRGCFRKCKSILMVFEPTNSIKDGEKSR